MRRSASKIALFIGSLVFLAGCENFANSDRTSGSADIQTAQSAGGSSQTPMQVNTAGLTKFEYVHNNEQFVAYSGAQTQVIEAKDNNGAATFNYKNGKLVDAINSNGVRYQAGGTNNADATALAARGDKLYKRLSYTAADKRQVNTGDDAKLNYLCITKIRQVAQTDRVFRSSANSANSKSRLTAEMRLNGNQFYKMDCQLDGNRVAKLSLMKK